jgi:glycosidase
VLIKAYQFAIAKYDVDGFRIDTLKYVERDFARIFGNSIREFALKIGKRNFFTFGAVWDNEAKITHYIGRYTSDEDGIIGVDAALDFPLFGKLQGTIKGLLAPDQVARIFEDRKAYQKSIISYHGEASKFFVTFLDNHDQKERFYYQEDDKYDLQVSQGIGALFTLQGIPCMYYGTEQGLHGRGDRPEAVREALWGKLDGFNTEHPFYRAIQRLSQIRSNEPALRYGRQYLREVSLNSYEFSISEEVGGVLAYSRILDNQEVLTVINTSVNKGCTADVIVDFALNFSSPPWKMLYSNVVEDKKNLTTEKIPRAVVQKLTGERFFGPVRAIRVSLQAMEIQILKKMAASSR